MMMPSCLVSNTIVSQQSATATCTSATSAAAPVLLPNSIQLRWHVQSRKCGRNAAEVGLPSMAQKQQQPAAACYTRQCKASQPFASGSSLQETAGVVSRGATQYEPPKKNPPVSVQHLKTWQLASACHTPQATAIQSEYVCGMSSCRRNHTPVATTTPNNSCHICSVLS
jgi:hypothetical protein